MPTPTPTPGTPGSIVVEFATATVTFKVANDWGTGFQADITIKNKTNQSLSDWKLAFQTDATVSEIWNARVVVTGKVNTFDALNSSNSWNKDVPPNGTASFGIMGTPGLAGTPPSNFTFASSGSNSTPVPSPTPTPTPTPVPSVATLTAPAANALTSFPQSFTWSINSLAPVRVYFARTSTPGLIIGSSTSVSGSNTITVSATEWTEITNDLGQSPVYYWTIGSANDEGKTLYTDWRPISDRRAKLLSPVDGVTLPSAVTTFTWDAGSSVQGYTLWIGSEPGTSDIYSGDEGTNRSRLATLPTDGRPVYVRLWSMLDGVRDQYFDYSFIAQKADSSTSKAQMVYPTNTTTFDSDTVNFAWDSGTGAQSYALWVGSAPGTSDIFSADEGAKLAETVTVPTDGRPVYVRLWTAFDGTDSQFNAYVYTSHFVASEPAKLLTPFSGTTLPSRTTTFTWDAGKKAEGYSLSIGSSLGASDIYTGNEGLNRSKTVSLPSDGRPVYVKLSTMFNGKWDRFNSYNFTSPASPASNVKAQILTPANVSTLTGSSVTFTWNAGTGAQEYWLSAGSTPGGTNYFTQSVGTSLSKAVTGLPADGSMVYVRLWTRFASGWGSTSTNYNDYAYTCQFVQASEAAMISPADQSTLPLGATTFTWSPGGRAQQYVLWIGSSAGANDLYSSSEDLRTSKTLTLPSDGRPVYVKLWTMIDGKLDRSRSYIYTTSIAPAAAKAQLTSPANGSTLASGTLDLQWTTASTADKYALWVGTTPGGSDIYGADQGKSTSRSITVPTVGQKIYVRLWTLLSGTWGYNDYNFATPVAASALARLTAPSNGSALPSATTTFTWDTGTGAQLYSLWVGSSPNTNDIYSGVEGLNLSRTLTLPRDGRPLYVQLWTMLNGTWSQSNYYTFTAFSPLSQVKAELVTPAAGALLPLGTTTFTWTAGVGATQYSLWIGSTPDGNDLYSGTEGTNLSKSIDLPADGRSIYVRLWSMFNGEWRQYNSYSFTAPIKPGPAKAQMATPANGSTLTSDSVTFTWSTGTQAQEYWLSSGSTAGGTDYFNQSVGTSVSQTIAGLPTNGSPVFVRLWTKLPTGWAASYNDYIYTAKTVAGSSPTPTPTPNSSPTKAAMTAPVSGSTLVGSTQTFSWNPGSGALEYWLDVGGTAGGTGFFTGSVGTSLSKAISGLPTSGVTVYSRLWTKFASGWGSNYTDYTYSTGAGATPTPTPTPPPSSTQTKAAMASPVSGSALTGSSQTFTWTAGSGALEYWLDVGAGVGGTGFFSGSVGTSLSKAINGLPTSGTTIYARLWTKFSSGWGTNYTDYTYTASALGTNGTKAAMTAPVGGSTLACAAQTFTWSAGSGGLEYWLQVGSTPGGVNYCNQSTGTSLSQAVSGLPTSGGPVYVRLWTKFSNGWGTSTTNYTDYTYTAATLGQSNTKAAMTAPVSGFTLAGNTQTFTWSAGSGGLEYWLQVGSTPGGVNYCNQSTGTSLSKAVSGLPTNGSPVYVRLWTRFAGGWGTTSTNYTDYTYTAAFSP